MSHVEPPAEKFKPGDVIGGFRIIERLASRGGFASIFRGEVTDTGRPVIVKSMKDGLGETLAAPPKEAGPEVTRKVREWLGPLDGVMRQVCEQSARSMLH